MKTSTQLAARLHEVILDGKWIANTNLKEQLEDVTLEQATHQVGDLNTIALLTFHLNYYIAGVLHFFNTGNLEIRDKYSFDLPPLKSEADWQNLKNELWSNTEQFRDHVAQLSEEQLNSVFVKEEYGDYRRSIDGTIEHCYYHLGQVVLIKKLVMAG
ncbi:MAG: DinB family protein [Cyclobacteriaceae bacterium]